MKNVLAFIVALGLLWMSMAVSAQDPSGQTAPASSPAGPPQSATVELGPMHAQLTTFVDTKHAKVGDQVTARLLLDLKENNNVILTQGAKLVGHVIKVRAHTKEHPDSLLMIVFEKAVSKGKEMPLHATIQALAAKPEFMSSDNSGTASAAGGGGNQAGGMPAAAAPASSIERRLGDRNDTGDYTGQMSGLLLKKDSRGVFGMRGINLAAPPDRPEETIIISSRNIELEPGMQMILLSRLPAR